MIGVNIFMGAGNHFLHAFLSPCRCAIRMCLWFSYIRICSFWSRLSNFEDNKYDSKSRRRFKREKTNRKFSVKITISVLNQHTLSHSVQITIDEQKNRNQILLLLRFEAISKFQKQIYPFSSAQCGYQIKSNPFYLIKKHLPTSFDRKCFSY